MEDVFSPDDVGPYRLHGEKFAGGHLLQRSGMEHVVHPLHGLLHALVASCIANIKFQLRIFIRFPHVILLFFVAAEHADLPDLRV